MMKAFKLGIASLVSFFPAVQAFAETCRCSFYHMGRMTANGEKFNPMGYTAASLSYSFGTMLRVSFNKKAVVVRVNDRGPNPNIRPPRCLDLSEGAAIAIGLHHSGIGLVRIQKLG